MYIIYLNYKLFKISLQNVAIRVNSGWLGHFPPAILMAKSGPINLNS